MSVEGIELSQSKVGARLDTILIAVRGYVDTMTCSILLNKITENLNSGLLHIIVDMAQVNYVSSAGWGVFVGEIKGIRERGGDLKIVQMTPEVYDVFEMLEFHRILSYYESIEEAINDFDLALGLDITRSMTQNYTPATSPSRPTGGTTTEVAESEPRLAPPRTSQQPRTGYQKRQIEPRALPLTEKIKQVVIENPNRGLFKIRKTLNSQKYGYTKVGIIQLWRLLRRLSLNDKEKRFRFYRSR